MATKTKRLTETEQADHYLDYLEEAWALVPQVLADWHAWDESDRLDLVLEWPIREERLAALQSMCERGELSGNQTRRLLKLQHAVERLQPAVEVLLAP